MTFTAEEEKILKLMIAETKSRWKMINERETQMENNIAPLRETNRLAQIALKDWCK